MMYEKLKEEEGSETRSEKGYQMAYWKRPPALAGKRVLITGVGFKPVISQFKDIARKPTHTPIYSDPNTECKANIGAAAALECAALGASVLMVARSEEKLAVVKKWVENEIDPSLLRAPGTHYAQVTVEHAAVDLSDFRSMERLVRSIPEDKPLYWVQSVGIGAGSVQLKDDNPYLRIDDITPELISAELSVLTNTIELMRLLLPRFRLQNETRICIVSSMSAIRSVIFGSMHNAAKAALSRFANAAMLELYKNRIFITDVRPGAIDTGLYDHSEVAATVTQIAASYGTDWSPAHGGLRLAPPTSVGKAIAGALSSEAHMTSINLVARGQWPHEGS